MTLVMYHPELNMIVTYDSTVLGGAWLGEAYIWTANNDLQAAFDEGWEVIGEL